MMMMWVARGVALTTTWERGAVTASRLRAAPGVGVAQAPLEWPPVAAAAAVGPRLALPLLRGAMGLLGVVPPCGPLRGRPMVESPRGPVGVIGISLTDTSRAIPLLHGSWRARGGQYGRRLCFSQPPSRHHRWVWDV